MDDQTDRNWQIDRGWLQGEGQAVRHSPSPNFGPRPPGVQPDALVIHNISLPPGRYGGDEIEHLFTNCLDWDAHPYFQAIRGLTVSAHLLIRRDGEILQFVSFDDRAWHAGQSCFEGRGNCNDFSIGIELEGSDDVPYCDEQYTVLATVTRLLIDRYTGLREDRITGHSDIAPGRKTDPGPAFDWQRYRQAIGFVY
ncbi:MAG: 1,6-anhydro-N-acetylmuramyl-L-alanine amidase AmpD [Parahaliea sp.]